MIQLAENAFLRTVPRPRGSQVRRGRSTLSVRQGLVIPRTVELSCRLANDPYGPGIDSATVRVWRVTEPGALGYGIDWTAALCSNESAAAQSVGSVPFFYTPTTLSASMSKLVGSTEPAF